MRILLKKAQIYASTSKLHGKIRDILIVNGKIEKIAAKIDDSKAKVITSPNLSVSPGWMDIGAYNGEPGYEYRETLDSLRNAASAGGFARVAVFPNTNPVCDTKQAVQHILRSNQGELVEVLPIGAATVGAQGADIAELIDIAAGGAIAISDGFKTQLSDEQLKRILEYIKSIGLPYIHMLAGDYTGETGQVNEGKMSVQLGLEGIAKVDEILAIKRLLDLAGYTENFKLIVTGISQYETSEAINRTNKMVYSSVPYTHLIFSDTDLHRFDVNLKILPPLRTEENRQQLVDAFNKGEISLIASNHRPRSFEEKEEPFGISAFGATGIQETFSALVSLCDRLDTHQLIKSLSEKAYDAIGMPIPAIQEEHLACLTVFDLTAPSTWLGQSQSLSNNSPIPQKQLQGKVIGVIHQSKAFWS